MASRRNVKVIGQGWFGLLSLCVMLWSVSLSWADPSLPPPSGLTASEQQIAMPTFRLPSVDGGTIDSAMLQGKVVVVRFWATW